jgi:hypothetical protein
MDEYEALEVHMKTLYTQYVLKFRNVTYVEHMQQDFDKIEQERNMVWLAVAHTHMTHICVYRKQNCHCAGSLNKCARMMAVECPQMCLRYSCRAKTAMLRGVCACVRVTDGCRPAAPVVQGNITGAGLSDDDDDTDTSLPSNDEEYDSDALVS